MIGNTARRHCNDDVSDHHQSQEAKAVVAVKTTVPDQQVAVTAKRPLKERSLEG